MGLFVFSFVGNSQVVTSVNSSKSDGSYKAGEIIPINVNFDLNVTVSGVPTLKLETGTNDAVLNYISGSETNSLLFNYLVESDHFSGDLDYFDINSLIYPPAKLTQKAAVNSALIGRAIGISARENYLFTVDFANPAFTVTDVSNPSSPEIKTRITLTGKPSGIRLKGDYAYISAAAAGVHIVDISDPLNPVKVSTFDTTGQTRDGAIDGDYFYGADSESGLVIIDISDPLNPTLKGHLDTDGHTYHIKVVGNYAYLADNANGIKVVDISDPGNPVLASAFNSSDSSSFAYGVNIYGNYAYLSCRGAGLEIYDISDPTDIKFIKKFNTGSFPNEFLISENFGYLAGGSNGVKIYNLSDPENPTQIDVLDTGFAWKLWLIGNNLYVGDFSSGFKIINTGGGSVKDLNNNDVVLTLPVPGETNSLSANKALVIDNTIPTVTNVTSNMANGSYKLGQQIPIAVTFSEPVTVTGKPTLTLETGTNDAVVDYSFGSGTDKLIFNYTVASDHNTSDLNYVNSNSLSGNITDLALNDADLSLFVITAAGSLGFNKALVIDGGIPTVINVTSSKSDGLYKAGDIIPVDVTFSEEVHVIGNPSITLETGASDAEVNYSSGTGTNKLTFNYTVEAGHTSNDLNYLSTNSLICPAPQLETPIFKDTTGEAKGVTVVGNFAYLADSNSGLAIIDITDPTNPLDPVYMDTNGTARGVIVVGNFAYVADFNEGLAIIDISDPNNPGTPVYKDTNGSAFDVTVVGDFAFVADNNSGLAIINVSNPASPGEPVYVSTNGPATSVTISGTNAYVADNSSGLAIIDITDPTNPGTPSYTPTNGSAYGVTVVGNNAYVADRDSGLAIIDISNPSSPGSPVYMDTNGSAYGVTVIGNYAYVSDSTTGLAIIDVTDPSNPGTPAYADTSFSYKSFISGTHAYVADRDSGLAIVPLNTGSIKDAASNDADLTLFSIGTTGSLSVNKDLVLDTTIPTVTNVTSSNANGNYKQGDLIPINITFSEKVNVRGNPKLTLETGVNDTQVSYSSGTGSDKLTFNYTVDNGHMSSDLAYLDSNSLKTNNSYNISVSAINNDDYSISGNDKNGNILASDPDLAFNVGDQITFLVNAIGHPYYLKTLPGTGTSNQITGITNNGTTNGSIVWTPTKTGTFFYQCSLHSGMGGVITITDDGSLIQDDALNNAILTLANPGETSSLSANKNLRLDTTVPTVTDVSSPTVNGSYKVGDIIPITVTFSEDVNITGIPNLALKTFENGASLLNFTSGSGTSILTFDYPVQPGHSSNDLDYVANNSLSLNSGTIKDASLNNANLTLPNPASPGSLGANKNLVINNAPIAVDDTAEIEEDAGLTSINVIANDTDADGDNLSLTLVSGAVNGTTQINVDTKSVDYMPNANWNGTDVISYTVSDGTLTDITGKLTITVMPVNDAPVVVDDTATVNEDSGLTTIDIVTNDTNVDGDDLTLTLVSLPANGTINLNADKKSVDYTPNANWNGKEVINYKVSDDFLSDNGTFTITVTPVNDAPVAVDDTATVSEDSELSSFNVIANDTDVELDVLTLTTVATSGTGTVAVNVDNKSVNYTPAANFNGTEVITYTVSDGTDTDATGTLTITVTPVNDAPVAVEDSITVNEDSGLIVIDVIANDTDVEGDTLTLKAPLSTTGTGAVALNADTKSVNYTPAANFFGTEVISYTISDGNVDSTGTLIITVSSVNDAPVAVDDTAFENENTSSNNINVISNDTDIEFDNLIVTEATTAGTGTVTVNADNKSVDYTPATNFNGTEVITYTVSDGTDTDTGTLTILVNDAPIAVDDILTVLEDSSLTLTDVIENDIDKNPLTLSAVTSGTGTVSIGDDNVSVKYIPTLNFNGTEVITYTASDGSLDTTGTFTITVTPVNDAPVAVDDTATVSEDSELSSFNVIANDTDVELDVLTLTTVATSGTGTVAVNVDNKSVNYTPAANFNGTEVITYTVSDGTDTDATGTLTITVTPVNDAPVAVEDSITVNEDSGLIVIDVIANDTDVEGDTLTLKAPLSTTGTGAVALNADTKSVNYTPAANFFGTEVISYTISDGNVDSTGTLIITVSSVNDAPVAVDDTAFENENTSSNNINVISNDTDIEFDNLIVTEATTAGTGTVTVNADNKSVDYTPATNFNGTEVITYTVSDGTDTDTGTLTILVNDAPIAVDDILTVLEDSGLSTINVIENDTDTELDILTLIRATTTGTGTVTVNVDNKSVDYTPATDFNGTELITYTVSDGNLTTLGSLIITVTPVNDAPIAVDDTATVNEDSGLTTIDIVTNDTNVDGDDLTITLVSLPANGTLDLNADKKSVDYTPNANWNGTELITYTISDEDAVNDNGTLTITVTPVNDAPVAIPQSLNVNNDVNLSLILSGTDQDINDVLTYIIHTLPVNGILLYNGKPILSSDLPKKVESLNLTYSTNPNYFGSDSFKFKVRDTSLAVDTAQIDINVIDANDPPVAIPDKTTVNEDSGSSTIDVIANDTDQNGDNLVLISITQSGNSTAKINGNSIEYTPNPNFNSLISDEDIIFYTVSDGSKTDIGYLAVRVEAVPDAPVAVDDTAILIEDSILNSINVIANDTDVDRDKLTLVGVSSTGTGTVEVNTTDKKSVNYTPAADFNGIETINYTVSDGILNDTGTLTVSVTAKNDVPVINNQTLILNIEDVSLDIDLKGNDVDGDNLNYFIVADPLNGIITSSDDKATYTPSSNFQGSVNFVYKANDGNVDSAPATVTIKVTSYDTDNDGVLNFNDDCPNTPPGTKVDIRGCEIFTLPLNNYNIKVTSSTCIDKDDGSIKINVGNPNYIYNIDLRRADDLLFLNTRTAWLTTSDVSFTDLSQGSYIICIRVFGKDYYKQCFKINIEQPKQLSAFLDVDNDKRTTNIQLEGSNNYNVEVNGEKFVVEGNNFITKLPTGLNIIKVSTDLECQGIIEKEVFISEDIHYYPNPTENDVNIHVSGDDNDVLVSVFSEKGELIYSKEQKIQDLSRKTNINLSGQITGVYIVVMESKTVRKTFKILKK